MNPIPPIFFKFSNSKITTIITIIAIAALAGILFSPPIFYSVEGKGNATGVGGITNSTTKFPGGITFETVHIYKKNSSHLCPDAPDLYCIGPYMLNETILKFGNVTPGIVPPVLPP